MGGGGYGDPVERDPNLVVIDVRERKISLESAEKIYGVILIPPDFMVDEEKTRNQRMEIIQDRKRRWTNAKGGERSYSKNGKGAKSILKQKIRIHESLVVEMDLEEKVGEIKCLKCNCVLCNSSQNYKEWVPYIDRNPRELKHTMIDPEWMIYREYYCPILCYPSGGGSNPSRGSSYLGDKIIIKGGSYGQKRQEP